MRAAMGQLMRTPEPIAMSGGQSATSIVFAYYRWQPFDDF